MSTLPWWIENGVLQHPRVPSGKHPKSYWKLPIEIVDLPMKNGDFMWFPIVLSTFTRPGKAFFVLLKNGPPMGSSPGMLHNSKVMDPSGSSAVLTQPAWRCRDVGRFPQEMQRKWDVRGSAIGKNSRWNASNHVEDTYLNIFHMGKNNDIKPSW